MSIFDFFKQQKNKKLMEAIKLHSAGATVIHKSPFEKLKSYSNKEELSEKFIDKWVNPFYFNLNYTDDDWINKISNLKSEITDEIILKNLGDFNWRTRQTGSYFASILGKTEFTEIIGTHLLKSEVCYAGTEYAKTLASFNTSKSIEFLDKYLDYYLLQRELYFDQSSVLTSLIYLDKKNDTNKAEKHIENWKKYMEGKNGNWEEIFDISRFEKQMITIEIIKNR